MRETKTVYIDFIIIYLLLLFLFSHDTNFFNNHLIEIQSKGTYPYTNKWYINSLTDLNPNNALCPACNFTFHNRKSNSCRDDFLFTTLLSKYTGLQPLIRTLRTTQTKARFIIFVDEYVQNSLTLFEQKLLNYCAINIINVGKIPKLYRYAYCFIRFYIYYDFIRRYNGKINRIIFLDGMDTIFQGDPFYEDFTPDKFILTLENRILRNTKWANSSYFKYFQKIHQENNDLYYNFSIINCGLILGGKEPIMKFLNIFKNRFDINELLYQVRKMEYVDQAILHSIILDGDLQKQGVKVYLYSIDDDYVSLSFGCWGWKCSMKYENNFSIGNFHSRTTGRFPLIVHQFNRYFEFSVSLLNACRPLQNNVSLISYIKDYPV